MVQPLTRREFLPLLGAPAVSRAQARPAPAAPVAIAKCRVYESAAIVATLGRLFDQLGGLGRLVKGKTVAVKLNLNGGPLSRQGHLPLGESHWPHPLLIGAMIHLIDRAGARRIRLLESAWAPRPDPLEENLLEANWDLAIFRSAAPRVEFENTNFLGTGKTYSRFKLPAGGHIYPAFDLNHSYEKCDTFVSIAKPKDHSVTGVTLVMKNLFGMTPLTVYGDGAGENEPSQFPLGSRMPILHYGKRQPPKSAPQEIDMNSSRDDGYRIPRIIADLTAARPVHLSVLDGITSMAGGQNPSFWNDPVAPGFLAAGTNVVCTSAVGMALMNYDPMAERGQIPFEVADNKLRLAEELGVGTRDLRRIEVIGVPIAQAKFDFKALRLTRKQRKAAEARS